MAPRNCSYHNRNMTASQKLHAKHATPKENFRATSHFAKAWKKHERCLLWLSLSSNRQTDYGKGCTQQRTFYQDVSLVCCTFLLVFLRALKMNIFHQQTREQCQITSRPPGVPNKKVFPKNIPIVTWRWCWCVYMFVISLRIWLFHKILSLVRKIIHLRTVQTSCPRMSATHRCTEIA